MIICPIDCEQDSLVHTSIRPHWSTTKDILMMRVLALYGNGCFSAVLTRAFTYRYRHRTEIDDISFYVVRRRNGNKGYPGGFIKSFLSQ